MTYSIFDGFAIDENGKVVSGAIVTITQSNELARIYENRLGAPTVDYPSGLLPNPLFSGLDGRITFYALPGVYRVSVVSKSEETFYDLTVPNEITTAVMTPYRNKVVRSSGEPIPGALVTVRKAATGELASLLSDETGLSITNPVTTNSLGDFSFRAGNGRYNFFVSVGNNFESFYDVLLDSESGTSGALDGGLVIVDPDVDPPVSYQMQIYWYSATNAMESLVTGGIPNVTAIYEASTREISLIQGKRVQEAAADVDFRVACVSGGIGLYLENVTSEPRMFIGPYNSGASMLLTAAWNADILDLEDMSVTENTGMQIGQIVPFDNGFIVPTLRIDSFNEKTSVIAKIIRFTVDDYDLTFVSVDLDDYPELTRVLGPGTEFERIDSHTFSGATSIVGFGSRITLSLQLQVVPFYYQGALLLEVDINTGLIVDYVAGAPFEFIGSALSSLVLLSTSPGTLDSYYSSAPGYSSYTSANGFGVDYAVFGIDQNDYEAFEYTSRTLDDVNEYVKVAEFSGVDSVDIALTSLVKAKLADYGFTVATPAAVDLFDAVYNVGAVIE
jgi:hypothetical protein